MIVSNEWTKGHKILIIIEQITEATHEVTHI
jgi:hypothetical protein